MWRGFLALLKKDFKLMLSGRFFLLALGSLILYSCYINFVYINLDQNIYPVYLYDPLHTQSTASAEITEVDSIEKLQAESRKDDVVTFEQLGVDRLFVDEAHNYKNRAKRCA